MKGVRINWNRILEMRPEELEMFAENMIGYPELVQRMRIHMRKMQHEITMYKEGKPGNI